MRDTFIDAATLVIPDFTPKPFAPKVKPVSAKTSSGEWPVSADALVAIRVDVDARGPQANGEERAYILIAACIGQGIDAGTHICEIGVRLGFNPRYIGLLLHAANAPWRKGPDGRYSLI